MQWGLLCRFIHASFNWYELWNNFLWCRWKFFPLEIFRTLHLHFRPVIRYLNVVTTPVKKFAIKMSVHHVQEVEKEPVHVGKCAFSCHALKIYQHVKIHVTSCLNVEGITVTDSVIMVHVKHVDRLLQKNADVVNVVKSSLVARCLLVNLNVQRWKIATGILVSESVVMEIVHHVNKRVIDCYHAEITSAQLHVIQVLASHVH